jgi:hypothetical protein
MVSPEETRRELGKVELSYPFLGQIPPECWDRNATVIREAMIAMGLDPADRSQLEAAFIASYLCLGHLVDSTIVVGPAVPNTYIQTRIFQKWLDGEMPVLSAGDMLVLEAMSPGRCTVIVPWSNGNGQSNCTQELGHDGPHTTVMIDHDRWGDASVVTIEWDEVT